MPDLTDLLDRTTPTDLAPPDVGHLARRAHRRRARHRAAIATAVVVPVVLMAVAVAGSRSPDRASDLDVAGGIGLSQPAGTWSAGAPSPLGTRVTDVFSGVLSDGRVLVWGGTTHGGHGGVDVVTPHADGAIYDPATDTWEMIPSAPVPPIATGDGSTSAQISHDRLAVVTGTRDSTAVFAAVYDVATGSWTAAPAQDQVPTIYDGMAWDGTTLALVRLDDGSHYDDPAARVDAPVTLRWSPGEPYWTVGAPPPLSLRSGAGDAATPDGLLALWGGIAGTEGLLADGAVYDVTVDSWNAIAPGPLGGRSSPSVYWSGGRLLVGKGFDPRTNTAVHVSDAAWYDPAGRVWTPIADAPSGGAIGYGDHVVAGYNVGHSGPKPVWLLGPEGWEETPLSDLHKVADLTVATSNGIGNPGDGPFAVKVRAGRDAWIDAAEVPFTNRNSAVVEATGTRLVVVGGAEGADLDVVTSTWVLDLTAP